MAWTVTFLKPNCVIQRVEELESERLDPFPEREVVRHLLSESIPDLEWRSSSLALLHTDSLKAQISIGLADPFYSVVIRVESGENPLEIIVNTAKRYGWIALDTQLNAIINLENPSDAGYRLYLELVGK